MNIGKRIRGLRKKKGLSLTEVSKKSNVALATLSRIETGKMTGTLESHMNIAKSFGMTLPEFYSEIDEAAAVKKEFDYADHFIHDKKASSIILTKDIFTKRMLPVLIKLEAGGKTHKEQLKKGSEKFIYVLEGKVEIVIGKESHILGKDATLYLDASHLHYIHNIGKVKASCICVVTPVTL